jgi:hypothetical protein
LNITNGAAVTVRNETPDEAGVKVGISGTLTGDGTITVTALVVTRIG